MRCMCSGFSVQEIYVVGDREEVVMLDAVSSYVLSIGDRRAVLVSAIPKLTRGSPFAICACVLKSKIDPAKVPPSWQLRISH